MEQFRAWRRRRRFLRVCLALRAIEQEHRAAGHSPELSLVSEAWLMLRCPSCPYYSVAVKYEEDGDG